MTQLTGEPLQEFSTTLKQMTHCAFPPLHEDSIHRGTGKASVYGVREWSPKWQLLLGSERSVSEAFRQTIELKVLKLAVRYHIRLWKTSDRTLWQSLHPPNGGRGYQQLTCWCYWSTGSFLNFCPHKLEEEVSTPAWRWSAICKGDHSHHVPLEKVEWQYAYSGWAALRR
jgi:hypothetical protein